MRRQINRSGPFPYQEKILEKNFRTMQFLEEVNRLGKAEGWVAYSGCRKRQSNIRRASSELARKRLVSMLEHSTTNLFNANPFPVMVR